MNTIKRPLEGVKCICAIHVHQAPLVFSMMADLGAEVIKIERPGHGDLGRGTYMVELENGHKISAGSDAVNRGLKSITLNIRSEEGHRILKELVKDADVFAENLRPGILDKYGLGYEELAKINSRLVYLSMSTFGPDGPNASRPGFDWVAESTAGFASGYGDDDTDTIMTTSTTGVADATNGFLSFGAVLAGLYHAKCTGEGQKIETSLLGGQYRLLSWHMATELVGGTPEPRLRVHIEGGKNYRIKGHFNDKNGKPFLIMEKGEAAWQNIMDVLEVEEALTQKGCNNLGEASSTPEKKKAFIEIMDRQTATRSREYWVEALRKVGIVGTAPINTMSEAIDDPDALANDYIIDVDHPEFGKIKQVGHAWKFSKTPAVAGIAPALGEHTEEVLKELGYSSDEIETFDKNGII